MTGRCSDSIYREPLWHSLVRSALAVLYRALPVGLGSRVCRTAALLTGTLVLNAPSAVASEVSDALLALSRQHGFIVDGLEYLAPDEDLDQPPRGSPADQVGDLLHHYNFLLIAGRERPIEKVVIVGVKRRGHHLSHSAEAVALTRDGVHHRVEVAMVGPNGRIVSSSLIVDTGASSVVLPQSMIGMLGFKPEQLQTTLSQTASGRVPVKQAMLQSVSVGSHMAANIGVTFVEDDKLGELRLLGMSFLSRFRVTLDDQKNELILLSR